MRVGPKNLEEMQLVHSDQEISPFAERIVAFNCKKSRYVTPSAPFLSESSNYAGFAYVEDQDFQAKCYDHQNGIGKYRYSLLRLQKWEPAVGSCLLTERILKEDDIEMRLATNSELIEIEKAVSSDQAWFEYSHCRKEQIDAIFKKALASSDLI